MVSWLAEYLEYTRLQESPEEFHMWAGITGVAGTLNRNVWLSRINKLGVEVARDYPGQLMTILVSGPGLARKTTAIGLIQELLYEANSARIFSGKITAEQLLTKLGSYEDKRAVNMIIAEELSTLLSRQQYNEAMIAILTKLANALDVFEYETKANKYRLLQTCVTLLGGTTPSSLGLQIPEEAHQHGFMSRVSYIYADASDKIEPLATDPSEVDADLRKESIAIRGRLVQGLRDMSRLKGPFEWPRDSRQWFTNWYEEFRKDPANQGEGWPSRRPSHMIRLGMILSVTNNMQPVLTTQSLEGADRIIKAQIEERFVKSFAYIGRHVNAEKLRRVMALFKEEGETIQSPEIYSRTIKYFADGKDLALALDTLRTAGALTCSIVSGIETWTFVKEIY